MYLLLSFTTVNKVIAIRSKIYLTKLFVKNNNKILSNLWLILVVTFLHKIRKLNVLLLFCLNISSRVDLGMQSDIPVVSRNR